MKHMEMLKDIDSWYPSQYSLNISYMVLDEATGKGITDSI